MSKSEDYGKALDQLEQLHQAGEISDARYEMHKQKLMTEASRPRIPVVFRVIIGAITLLLLIIIIRSIWIALA